MQYVEEYGFGGFLKKLAKGLGSIGAGVGLNALVPGLGLALSQGIGSGLFTGLANKDLKKGLLAGMTGYVGGKALTGAAKSANAARTATAAASNAASGAGAAELAVQGVDAGAHLTPRLFDEGIMGGIKSLGTGAGARGALDSLADIKNVSFLYPQMGNLAQQIENEKEDGESVDPYWAQLRGANERWRRQRDERRESNPYGMWGYSDRGYAKGGPVEEPWILDPWRDVLTYTPGTEPEEDDGSYLDANGVLRDANGRIIGDSDEEGEGYTPPPPPNSGADPLGDLITGSTNKNKPPVDDGSYIDDNGVPRDKDGRIIGDSDDDDEKETPDTRGGKKGTGLGTGQTGDVGPVYGPDEDGSGDGSDDDPEVGDLAGGPSTGGTGLDTGETGDTERDEERKEAEDRGPVIGAPPVAEVDPLNMSPRVLRGIAEGFAPGYMPEYEYFAPGAAGGPQAPPMDISQFPASVGSNPFDLAQFDEMTGGENLDALLASLEAQSVAPEGYAQGGQVEGGGVDELVQQAAMALMGQVPPQQAEQILQAFVQQYGEEALEELKAMLAQQQRGQPTSEGMIEGGGGGMSDDVPASVQGANPVALSAGEFIVPADAVSMLGDGNSGAGADVLQQMVNGVREQKTGSADQASPLDFDALLGKG